MELIDTARSIPNYPFGSQTPSFPVGTPPWATPQVNGQPVLPMRYCPNICNPIVVAGYPGVGKTMFYNKSLNKDNDESKFEVYDSDSSKHKENWPWGYLNHIQEKINYLSNQDRIGIIFVSTHKDIICGLINAGVRLYICYPDISLKDAYLKRYEKRGSDEKFVELMNTMWETFHESIEDVLKNNHSLVKSIKLHHEDSTLSSVLRYLLNRAYDKDDFLPNTQLFYPITANNWDRRREFVLECLRDYRMHPTVPLSIIGQMIEDLYANLPQNSESLVPIYQIAHWKGLIK